MRHDSLSGKAALERADLEGLRPREVKIPDYRVAASSDKTGVPRRQRRMQARIARKAART